METKNNVGRPIVKPKRIPTTFGMNISLHEQVASYVTQAKQKNKKYSINDFVNEAIIDKLNGGD